MAKNKYYVIWIGHKTGIVDNWDECLQRTKGYKGARYKGFKTLEEAQKAYETNWSEIIPAGNNKTRQSPKKSNTSKTSPIQDSLAVDAACSGNPGPMEYRGVHVGSNQEWFHAKFTTGTNNVGEFLAIVHGLGELKRKQLNIPIYTDSTIALGWIKKKKCITKLERTPQTEKLFQLIERAENWLNNNHYSQPVLKWETKDWGEIPADFGRK
ncbi:MAG: viroplasmin family protein [bacterium]